MAFLHEILNGSIGKKALDHVDAPVSITDNLTLSYLIGESQSPILTFQLPILFIQA